MFAWEICYNILIIIKYLIDWKVSAPDVVILSPKTKYAISNTDFSVLFHHFKIRKCVDSLKLLHSSFQMFYNVMKNKKYILS